MVLCKYFYPIFSPQNVLIRGNVNQEIGKGPYFWTKGEKILCNIRKKRVDCFNFLYQFNNNYQLSYFW